MLKKTLAGVAAVFAALIIGAAAVGTYFYYDYQSWKETPAREGDEIIAFEIPKGCGVAKAKKILTDAKFIDNSLYFDIYAKEAKLGANIKAGYYEAEANSSPAAVLKKIIKGEVALTEAAIPEGITVKEIADRLATAKVIAADDKERFLSIALSREGAAKFGVNAPSLEGFLFPDTYRFAKLIKPEEAIAGMIERFNKTWTEEFDKRAKELNMSKREVITLASIIEKETGSPDERELVSSVYHNRLNKNMKLEADPTVIYGIKDFDGNIRRRDLLTDHPYNTYTRKGLPPGPIASPGLASIRAALYPAKTEYIFFVAMNNGRSKFSKTYAEHAKAVYKYQIQGKVGP